MTPRPEDVSSLFVFGFGYSARAVVKRMRPKLDAVWGTARNQSGIEEITTLGVTPVFFDGRHSPPP
jgi:hypothetical protein